MSKKKKKVITTKVYDKSGPFKKLIKVHESKTYYSAGEETIASWLSNNKIKYTREKKFPWLLGINNGEMRLDFFLPDHNIAIEFDGVYHDINEYQKKNDSRKNSLLKKHRIKLIRIHYKKSHNIDKILKLYFGKKKKKK